MTTFSYEEFTHRNIGFISKGEQEILKNSSVFVAGVGGMGGAAAACLVRTGLGRIVFADMDVFEVSNLNRQIFANLDTVGKEKTAATAEGIRKINPECKVEVYDISWSDRLWEILPTVHVAINGCDDPRATLQLMRQGKNFGKTVIDAFASTLPNVYAVTPSDPRPEEVFGYPSVGVPIHQLTPEILAGCVIKELEWVMTNSSTVEHVELDIAGELINGKRKRFSFAPMVWMTGCLMAYEAIRVILHKPGGPGPGGVFHNPWSHQVERPLQKVLREAKRILVKQFMSRM